MTEHDTPLDRLFDAEPENRPDDIVVDELTTMDTDEFVARLESLADAAEAVTDMAEDVQRLRAVGLSDEDARDLIYGRNSGLPKRDIDAMFEAIDEVASGRADKPAERLLAAVSGLTLAETAELMDELDRLHSKYGDNDG